MNDQLPAAEAADQQNIKQLRDRTDELELIISSLTTFALFSIPGWLFDTLAGVYTHLSTSLVIATNVGMLLVAGGCYGLAACFVLHLMARAYWVGLIGLRTAYPGGIQWRRTPSLGPIGREYYRRLLPDLDTVIRSTDRLASSLFAVISMLTLGALWFGTIMVISLIVSGLIGSRFGATNLGLGIGFLVLLTLFVGLPLLTFILDAQLAARLPWLKEQRFFGTLIRSLRGVSGLAYPRRLILPVQLTLQSNTRPVMFLIVFALGVGGLVFVGSLRLTAWQQFTLSDQFTYLDNDAVRAGFLSTYYEDMASPRDRLRAWPRVSQFDQSGAFARLFLPYQPLRDNLVLEQICGENSTDPASCLRQLWAVSIQGESIPMSGFVVAERGDLGMRGLIGLVPLEGLEPGLHRIEVTWNPIAGALSDDRYDRDTVTYAIPIAFYPNIEASLP